MSRVIQQYLLLLEKKQKVKIITFFLCIIVSGLLETLSVSVMLPLVIAILDISILERIPFFNNFIDILKLDRQSEIIIVLLLFFFLLIVLKNSFVYLTKVYQRRFIVESCYQTSSRLFNIYLHCDYEQLMMRNSADVITDVTSLVNRIFLLLEAILNLVAEVFVMVSLIVFMFFIDKRITMIVVTMLMILLVLFRLVLTKKARYIGEKSNECYRVAVTSISEAIHGIKEIQLMNREQVFYNTYRENGALNVDLETKKMNYETAPSHITEIMIFGGVAVYIIFAVLMGADMSVMIAQLSAVSLAAVRLIPAMNRINGSLSSISFYYPALDKISDQFVRYMKDEKVYRFEEPQVLKFKEKLEFADVTYSYPNTSNNVLQHAQLTIYAGQKIGIVGESGAGKTTLIDIMLGYLHASEGEICADGIDIATNYKGWMQNIGYIPQMIFMLDDSIRNNVLFGVRTDSDDLIWEVLKKAQIDEFVRALPEGLNTRIGERGIRLSGGQRQRIGIARALYSDPDLLVFDEATAALDPETEREVMKAVYTMGNQKTMILIAHNIKTLDGCDKIYRVKDMKIVDVTEEIHHGNFGK